MPVKLRVIDLGMDDFIKQIRKLKKEPSVEIGVFSDVKVRKKIKGNIDNVGLMAIHEFGIPNSMIGSGKMAGKNHNVSIPKRSVIRSSTDENKEKLNKFVLKEYDKIIKGKNTFKKLFKRIGIFMENKFKLKFTDGTLTPNAESTIKQKGSSKPLINTGQLRQSIKSKVFWK